MALYMGRVYEATGERENARRAYEWLTIAWRDPDPEIQPRVEEAKAALGRL